MRRKALLLFLCLAIIVGNADAIFTPVTGKLYYISTLDTGHGPSLFAELKASPLSAADEPFYVGNAFAGNPLHCDKLYEIQDAITANDMVIILSRQADDDCDLSKVHGTAIHIFSSPGMIRMKYRIHPGDQLVQVLINKGDMATVLAVLKIAFFDHAVAFLSDAMGGGWHFVFWKVLASIIIGVFIKCCCDSCDAGEIKKIQDEIEAMKNKKLIIGPKVNYPGRKNLPYTPGNFRKWMKYIVEVIIDYMEHPEIYRVTPDVHPGFLYVTFPKEAPQQAEPFIDIIRNLVHDVIPNMLHWQHPRFHAYFATGCSYPDIMADALVSGFGNISFSWDSCPVYAELECGVMNWLAKVFKLPKKFLFDNTKPNSGKGGGAIQDSASDCVLVALLTARNKTLTEEKIRREEANKKDKKDEKDPYEIPQLVAYASKEAHSCIEKAARLALVHLRCIEPNDRMEMTYDALKRAMDKDRKDKKIPFFVHATTGTTATGAYDQLADIIKLKDEEPYKNVWIHVDAAYGGTKWILDGESMTDDLESVNSVNINLHKVFLHSSSAGCLWTSEREWLMKAMNITPVYLTPSDTSGVDFRNWGIPLTRRQRFMKAWFVLRLYGVNGMKKYVERLYDLSRYMHHLLSANQNITIVGTHTYTVSAFQLKNDPIIHKGGVEYSKTKMLASKIRDSGKLAVTFAEPGGKHAIRISISHQMSTETEVLESYNILANFIQRFLDGEDIAPDHRMGPDDPPHPMQDDPGAKGSPGGPPTDRDQVPLQRARSHDNLGPAQ